MHVGALLTVPVSRVQMLLLHTYTQTQELTAEHNPTPDTSTQNVSMSKYHNNVWNNACLKIVKVSLEYLW